MLSPKSMKPANPDLSKKNAKTESQDYSVAVVKAELLVDTTSAGHAHHHFGAGAGCCWRGWCGNAGYFHLPMLCSGGKDVIRKQIYQNEQRN